MPAIGTNDLTPETLDVTPSVGRLVDGGSHDLAVRIFGARDTWNVEANLLMFTDHGATRTSGALVSAAVATDRGVSTTVSSIAHGSRAVVSADRSDRIVGWVQTSAGPVTTTVTGSSAYRSSNDITGAGLTEDVTQTDHGAQRSVSRIGSHVIRSGARYFSYLLSVLQQVTSYTDDQNFALAGTVSMTRSMVLTKAGGDGSRPMGTPTIFSSENVHSPGTLARTDGATSTADGDATAYFLGTDDAGHFYRHYLAAQHGKITDDKPRLSRRPRHRRRRALLPPLPRRTAREDHRRQPRLSRRPRHRRRRALLPPLPRGTAREDHRRQPRLSRRPRPAGRRLALSCPVVSYGTAALHQQQFPHAELLLL